MNTTELLNKGPVMVRHTCGDVFMLSLRTGTGGVIGMAAFKVGQKPPRFGRHTMVKASIRDEYLAQLTQVEVAP